MPNNNVLLALAAAGLASAQTIKSSLAGGNEISEAFVSYSIEFSSFPDFAGNSSKPNKFSDNLLSNIGNIIGTKPYVRVGGNTQDFALYDASLPVGLKGVYTPANDDYPSEITIGPSFFESYKTWDNVKFSHGFNMALGATTDDGWQTLLDTVPLACKALSGDKLYYWEYGNEPDLFKADYDDNTYMDKYSEGTTKIAELVKQHCGGTAQLMAPSLSGVGTSLDPAILFGDGFDQSKDIGVYSTHGYISGALIPGVTLAGTLLSHKASTMSIDAQVEQYNAIQGADASAPPMILGETNSLYNQGRPGLSNTFGAALWGVDYQLYAASVGIQRVHFHQGTNYRYASWQPIMTDDVALGTKAPYYGNVAVAAMIGNFIDKPSMIANIPMDDDQESAYAAYVDSGKTLVRAMLVNLNAFNSTEDGEGVKPLNNAGSRPSKKYSFTVEGLSEGTPVLLQRLMGSGSDAISGISWDGYSYNYEEAEGMPSKLNNVTVGEVVKVGNGGVVTVDVPDSSAVMLNFGVSKLSGSDSNHGESSSSAAQSSDSGSDGSSDSDSKDNAAGRNAVGAEILVFFCAFVYLASTLM